MKKALVFAVLFLCWAVPGYSQASFMPPELVSAPDPYIAYQNVVDGIVVLDVFINSSGTVSDAKPLRDPGSLVPAAITALRRWKFVPTPATVRNSEMTVAFVYRPPTIFVFGPDLRPVLPYESSDSAKKPDFVPVGILAAAYPAYPLNTVSAGSVVLQVTVNASGQVQHVGVIREKAPFTKSAIDVLQKWKFRAATLHNRPILARVAIAFVFQTPAE
jgi:TonB family protein